MFNLLIWCAKAFISALAGLPVPVLGREGTWKTKRGCQNLGRCRWQSALISLVLSCVESKTTASPKRSSGQLVMAKSAVR